jgi:hypothetical protein
MLGRASNRYLDDFLAFQLPDTPNRKINNAGDFKEACACL